MAGSLGIALAARWGVISVISAKIDYSHSDNWHSVEGARAALPFVLASGRFHSLLDVGCGRGHWIAAAQSLGIEDIYGVDGVGIDEAELLFSRTRFKQINLDFPFDLGRRFDIVLCLEVAEHLEAESSRTLIGSLAKHGDTIAFSAAIPGQPGQHHVNCQWPGYWQTLFNEVGYRCEDSLRWLLWQDATIEPWYRQNMFMAYRDPIRAGQEDRIAPVVHPDMFAAMRAHALGAARAEWQRALEKGQLSPSSYVRIALLAPYRKLARKLGLTS